MTFLNPLYLFGLLAAGIPIVIHLLTRRRPKRIPFSSVEFLREVNVAQLRRFRLREFLLLALRTLAIALLALALSKPALKGAVGPGAGQANSSVVLLIDRSASMGALEGKELLSARAQARARAVLESLDAGDEVQVIAFDAEPEALFPQPSPDLARAGAAVASIEPRPFATDLDAAVGRGLAVLRQSARVNKELYVISDLQRAGLPGAGGAAAATATAGADSGAALGAAPSGLRFYVLPLAGALRPENLAVTGARLRGAAGAASGYVQAQAGPASGLDDGAAVDVTVQSFGGAGGEVAVGVRSGGRELGRAFVPLGAGEGRALVPLSARPDGGGEAFLPEDALEIDNHRWFAAGPGGRIRVALVEGGSRGVSPLALALGAGQEAGRVDVVRLESGALTAGTLAGFDALVLNDVAELGENSLAAVVDHARGGGGVAIILGPRASATFYGARLFPALGGLRVGDAPRLSGGGQWTLRLAAPGHPAFEGFAGRSGDPISQAAFRQAWPLSPGPSTRVLARFAPDLPAMVEDGRLLVFASDVEGAWNDFPTRGAFLPLWIQSLTALAQGAASDDLRPGQRFTVAVPVGAQAADLRFVDPAGRAVPLEQSLADGRRRLVSPPLTQVGLHRLAVSGRPLRDVAVNLDPRESDLARLSPAEARARWAAYKPIVLEGDADLARRIREGRFGRELAGLLLLLAFLCLVAESAVGRLMTPSRA